MKLRASPSLLAGGAVFIGVALGVALRSSHRHERKGPRPKSAPEGRPATLLPTDPPYLDAVFTRPEPGTVPGVGPEDTGIRDEIEGLLRQVVSVPGSTDVHIAAYDWDQFWNGGPDAQNRRGGGVRDGWPDPVCGATFCCGGETPDCDPKEHACSATACGPSDAPPYCKASFDPIDELVARGVVVKALFNRGKSKAPVRRWLSDLLASAPCRTVDGAPSDHWCGVKVCGRGMDAADCAPGGGCLGNGNMHVKMVLFRKLAAFGGSEHNVFLTSANFDYDQLLRWNDAVVIYNDEKLYDGLRAYYEALWSASDAPRRGYVSSLSLPGGGGPEGVIEGSRGIVKAYLFPRNEYDPQHLPAGLGPDSADLVCRLLDRVRRGTVLIAASWLSRHRPQIAAKLVELARDRRIDVRVIVDSDIGDDGPGPAKRSTVDKAALDALLQGGFPVRVAKVGIHHKMMLVDGEYQGVDQRIVFTGTANLTVAALKHNDEVLLEIKECETPPCSAEVASWGTPPTGSAPNNDLFQRYEEQWIALCKRSKRYGSNAPRLDDCDVGMK